MLIAYVMINEKFVDKVFMHNQGVQNAGRKSKYKVWLESDVSTVKEVWHHREDGWQPLLSKSLKALKKTKAEKFADELQQMVKDSGVELRKGMNPKSKSQARRMIEQSR